MSEENKDLFLENGNESQAEEIQQNPEVTESREAVTESVEAAEAGETVVAEPIEPAEDAEPVVAEAEEIAEKAETAEAEEVKTAAEEEDPDDAAIEELRKFAADVIEKAKSNIKSFAIAFAAVILFLAVLNAGKIANAAVKLFTSPAGYFRHVEGDTVKQMAKETATAYDTAISEMLSVKDFGTEGSVGVEMGKEILDFLEDKTDMEFEWLKEFSVGFGMDSTQKGTKAEFDFSLDGKKIISLLTILNMEDGKAFLQIPELNESYLGIELEEFFEMCDVDMDLDDINEMYEMYEKIYDALPDKSKVEKIMKRYGSFLLSAVDDVEQYKDRVTVGDYYKKMTVLEATIDEKTVQDALELVVKELKKDKDVKKIIFEVAELQDELDADEIYDEFLEALDDLEDEIDDFDDEEFEIIWKTYVDNKGNIQGRTFELEDEDVEITSLMVKKGTKFAYEFTVEAGSVQGALTGSGKMRGLTVSGDFVLDVMGMDLLNAKLDDVKMADLCRGDFSGTISISLPKAVAKMLDAAADLPFDLKDIVLKIDMDTSTSKSDVKVSLLEEDELIVAISAKNKKGKADSIKSPKSKDVVMVEDESDLEEWTDEIDVDAFVESLEGKIGEDLYELLEDVLSNGFTFGEKETSDDYWYDDDYWYEDWY